MDIRKCNILLPYSCRSDSALTQPIINRLEKEDWCNLTTIPLVPANYFDSFKRIEKHLSLCTYDLAYITGDRVEMGAAAQAAFLSNTPICHYGSGITNYPPSCYDDFIRHQIAIVSDILLCEDFNSYGRMKNMEAILRLNDKEIYIVGNLYLDDLPELDFSLVPTEPYDLILINAETLNPTDFIITKIEVDNTLKIFIGSNPDKEITYDNIYFERDIKKGFPETHFRYYNNIPRSQFLGLLKNCKRYITNSSSSVYEAPLYLKPEQIIKIGERNKNRSSNFEEMQKYPNTANRIITILKEWWLKNEKKI